MELNRITPTVYVPRVGLRGRHLPPPGEGSTGKRALLYIRVSTKMQIDKDVSEEGFSLPAQRDACVRTAELLGAEVVDEYVERGETARTANRPELQRLLARLKHERDADYVIVHKLDRLIRSRDDDSDVVRAIRAAGATLVSATEAIDDRTPNGRLLHGIMATLAEFYSQNLATEVLKGMTQKARLGGTPGKAPVGYRNIIERVEGKDVRTVIVDPERAPHVRWAFEAYATGDYLIRELAEDLADRGLTTVKTGKKGGRPMSVSAVELMLANPYYIGIVTFRGAQYTGRHEPLIDIKLWDEVQALKEARRHSKAKPYKHPHYLKGSLFCRCGSRLGVTKVRKPHGVEYDYFYCLGRQKRQNGCQQKYVSMESVERGVERIWRSVQLPDDVILAIRDAVTDFVESQAQHQVELLESHTARITALEAERLKLMNAYYIDAIGVDVLKAEQERIAAQIRESRAILDGARTDRDAVFAGLERFLSVLGDCGYLYEIAPQHIRRQFNQAAFERIVIDDGEVDGFYLRSPFTELFGPIIEAEVPKEEIEEIEGFEGRRYHREPAGPVSAADAGNSLRVVFENESGATVTTGSPAEPVLTFSSLNVAILVPPTGFEPVPPA